jgi:hypothetical protein
MDVDHMDIAEKRVYWKAFYAQHAVIDQFRQEMVMFNPQWATVESSGLTNAVNQVFEGNSEHEFALKAVIQYRDEELASELLIRDFQIELDFEFACSLE